MSDHSAFAFSDLLEDDGRPGWKAQECLRRLSRLSSDDLARAEWIAAAQVYAILEVAALLEDVLMDASGRGIADVLDDRP